MFLLITIYTNCMPSILPQHSNIHNSITKHDNIWYIRMYMGTVGYAYMMYIVCIHIYTS